MTSSNKWLPRALATLLVVVLYGALLSVAFAEHGTQTLNASPEQTRAPVNTRVFIEAKLSAPAEENVNIDAEIEDRTSLDPREDGQPSPNDEDAAADDPHEIPDFTCNISAGGTRCFISYVGGEEDGTDQMRLWVDEDGEDSNFDADADEMRGGDTSQEQGGTGDHCNEPGPDDPPAPNNPSGEPDCTDVVHIIWSEPDTQADTLDCDDATGPDRERETNAAGESETYTCRLRTDGARGPRGTVYAEVNGSNDPDDVDGASYDEWDYFCVGNTGDPESDCTITVTQNEGEAGLAEICFWTLAPGDSDGAGLCDGEDTGEEQQPTLGDVGNDRADQVELTWSAATTTAGTTTTRSTTTSSTTSGTTSSTTSGTTRTTTTTTTSSTTETTTSPGSRSEATDLTISYSRPEFSGSAGSAERRCQTRRLVTVKKKRPGRDRVVGTDRTDRNGNYSVRSRRARGQYYAKAAKKVFTESDGTRVVCQPDRSNTIRVRRRR